MTLSKSVYLFALSEASLENDRASVQLGHEARQIPSLLSSHPKSQVVLEQ